MTPYQALYGRIPPLYDVLTAEHGQSISDANADVLRNRAIQAMVQATAEAKMGRADRTKTRAAAELLELAIGDQVDIFRKGNTKDVAGWFGPGTQSVNFERLCSKELSNVAFLQFFSEDSESVAVLRETVVEVPNLGGVYEPALPPLRDVTEQVERRRALRQLQDAVPVNAPEEYDIGTPTDEQSEEQQMSETSSSLQSDFPIYQASPPEVCVDAAPEAVFLYEHDDFYSEPPQLAFDERSAKFLSTFEQKLQANEMVVFNFASTQTAVIERVNNIITRAEALANVDRCREAMVKELLRWGQRLLTVLAVQFNWKVASADVSEAFLRGLTFEELHKTGHDAVLREVQLILPAGSLELVKSLPGMSDFDPSTEVLHLLKPGFGLKDAPRLWNLALQKVLKKLGLVATQADPQFFIRHNEHGQLVLAMTTHVDDLKITGHDAEIAKVIKGLEEAFLHSALDLSGLALTINSVMTEVLQGTLAIDSIFFFFNFHSYFFTVRLSRVAPSLASPQRGKRPVEEDQQDSSGQRNVRPRTEESAAGQEVAEQPVHEAPMVGV
ncbi:RE2 [Symbiodinium natans]|uniref:RE2 protein n=1 Tax=Symbiodinium natans TaxID=878477 RepID=A0A812JIB8_9DINO|nr:RE2 [Symbiodinium natans]